MGSTLTISVHTPSVWYVSKVQSPLEQKAARGARGVYLFIVVTVAERPDMPGAKPYEALR